jgi:hypothetical protein
MGSQLTGESVAPIAVEIDYREGQRATGVAWVPGDSGLLFLHSPGDPAASDAWGAWPDHLAQLGYAALAIDLPEGGNDPDETTHVVGCTLDWLRCQGARRIFILAAERAVAILKTEMADAFVLVAPETAGFDPAKLGTVPKLIVAGSADTKQFDEVQRFARQCRGWTLLSSFVVENTLPALLGGRSAPQIGAQIAEFLQEYRVPDKRLASNPRIRRTD